MARYVATMIALALLALAVARPPSPPITQARAAVRILVAARLRVGAERSEEGKAVRPTVIHERDGTRSTAHLVEFE